jgi:hypothetical protein
VFNLSYIGSGLWAEGLTCHQMSSYWNSKLSNWHAEHIDFEAFNFSHQCCFCDALGILSFLSNWNFSYNNIVHHIINEESILVDHLLFYVPLRKFSLFSHCQWLERRQIVALGSGSFSREGFLSPPPVLTRGLSFFVFFCLCVCVCGVFLWGGGVDLVRRTNPFSRLLRCKRVFGGSTLTRILTASKNAWFRGFVSITLLQPEICGWF